MNHYTDDDRVLAALSYPLPILALFVLVSEEKRARPFLKFHAVQALTLCLVLAIVSLLVSLVTYGLGCVCTAPLWITLPLWPAYQVYHRGAYEAPVLCGFVRRRGWVDTETRTGDYL